MWQFLHKFLSAKVCYQLAQRLTPWLMGGTGVLFVLGLWGGLVLAPPDYQQGDAFRIIYVHVPSAFLSLGIYSFMTVCAIISLVWRIKIADVMLQVSAPLGAWMTFLALVTGSIWGKPMWGTWWMWDARLTSELILLFIYLSIIGLRQAISNPASAAKAVAILVIIGCIDLPIIHYSVYWWNTLHQGATIAKFGQPSIDSSMLYPLLLMIAAFACYFAAQLAVRVRSELLRREAKAAWIDEVKW